ncbi:polysaccharide deacetylase family protein [Leptospira fluminis]|uniref:Polysaccharide deacetylase family protein n=1 Tax=Leptospira fluminis TaxID=2484979 RepID=A0A4R9GLK1_9LEPT|nr:polysaccharide deacetylase family protein [Leptospira fluminis]TGK15668.1 polysaccharide deacetylase family protein [Leptospira fluminis]
MRFSALILFYTLVFSCATSPDRRDPTGSSARYGAVGFYDGDPVPDKVAYLTFDDGPSDWTSEILDVLRSEKIPATFFICGIWAPNVNRTNNSFRKFRDVLVRMRREGHAVGNHTIGHRNLMPLSEEKIRNQFRENQEMYDRELGKESAPMTLLRPPFGSPFNRSVSEESKRRVGLALRREGIVAMWSKHFDSSDSKDWVRGEWYEKGPRVNLDDERFKAKMERIYSRLVSGANGKGIVVLFHDTHPTTKEILTSVIRKLHAEGYRFATMEEYSLWRWGKSSSELLVTERNSE